MAEPGRWWRIAVAVFVIGNVASAVYHAAVGEFGPAAGHAGVAAGTIVFWMTVFSRKREPEYTADSQQIDSQIDHLQQSVDAIALEVERLGEGQRFAQKILQTRLDAEKEAHQ
jgi:hypothetical protein